MPEFKYLTVKGLSALSFRFFEYLSMRVFEYKDSLSVRYSHTQILEKSKYDWE